MSEKQPFKKRLEITFGESDRELWEWLEQKSEKKATFIKKILQKKKIVEEMQLPLAAAPNNDVPDREEKERETRKSNASMIFQAKEL